MAEQKTNVTAGVPRQIFEAFIASLEAENIDPEVIARIRAAVCDTEWDVIKLREIVEGKLKKYSEIQEELAALKRRLEKIVNLLAKVQSQIALPLKYAQSAGASDAVEELVGLQSRCAKQLAAIESLLPLGETVTSMRECPRIPDVLTEALSRLSNQITSIPDTSALDLARTYLIIGQDRLDVFRSAASQLKADQEDTALATKIYDAYEAASTKVLTELYNDVAGDFTNFYRFINSEDEESFVAKLLPSQGKLAFDVDFYGRGTFPPGAYHSEGHQDGMGLCLYLALMQRLLGSNFSFAVLDDVLMSVDVAHREGDFKKALAHSKLEEWQINPAIHYNEWANFQRTDFEPVIESFKTLLESFICPKSECRGLLYVLPERGERESIRCLCGSVSINLNKK